MNARPHTLSVLALLVGGLALACREPTASPPVLPAGSVPLTLPQVYAAWWRLTESCSQKAGDIRDVTWYHVPGARTIIVRDREYKGYWYRSTRTIVLAGQSVLDGPLVRHEMLHELSLEREHVRQDFAVNCQGVVQCEGECVDEAGVPDVPAPDAPEVALSEFDLSVEVTPPSPTVAGDSGWVAIDVRVANPGGDAWAPLRATPDNETSFATFGYLMECVSHCPIGSVTHYSSAGRLGLPAQSSRRMVFDRRLEPGTYVVRGTFNSDTTAAVTITVRP